MARFIVGTAGHIDHGKSTLVRALTGTDPDRLPEEKRRGITVDLGYAFFGDIAAIIDVPGHERLIRNMVAGAATVDFALLVIAADDGVMPQTTEHLQILRLLGIRNGAIVITKCDVVDKEWCDLVEDQIRSAVSATFLANARIFRVDSVSGRGVEELSQSLTDILAALPPREDRGVFRLPIDRVFSMKGRGTVVTGTVLAGAVQKDMRLIALPGQLELRVKRVESHGREVDRALAGQRAALNLIGDTEKLDRGQTLTVPDGLITSTRLRVFIENLPSSQRLKDRLRIRFLIATQEVIGRIQLLGGENAQHGIYANVLLENEVTAAWGDHFILRRYSPLETLGGGIVLDPSTPRLRARDIQAETEIARSLNVVDIGSAMHAYILHAAPFGISVDAIAAIFGIPAHNVLERCRSQASSKEVMEIGAFLLSRSRFDSLCEDVKTRIRKLHDKSPENAGFSRAELRPPDLAALPVSVYDHILQDLLRRGVLEQEGALYREPQRGMTVSPAQADLMERVQDVLRNSDFVPPSATALAEKFQRPVAEIEKTLVLLERAGKARRLSTDLFFDVRRFDVAVETIRRFFENNRELTVSEAARILNSSRKYVVPFLEYLDNQSITMRTGKRSRPWTTFPKHGFLRLPMACLQNRIWTLPVLTAVIIGLCIRIILLFVTPVGGEERAGKLSSYNDEIAHVHYVKFIIENNRLPAQMESIQAADALARGFYENYQPPLYYIAVAGIGRIFGCESTAAIAVLGRLIALLCSLAILWLLLRIANALHLSTAHSSAVVIFWALNGVFVRFAATAGNDALFWLLGGGMLLLALKLDRPDPGAREMLLFAAVAVAALYTKLSALLLLPLPLIALRHKSSHRTYGSYAAAYAVILVATLPLWVRNIRSFGSLIPLDAGFGHAIFRLPDWAAAAYAIRSLIFPWHEFWSGIVGLAFMVPLLCIMVWSLFSRNNRQLLFRTPVLAVALVLTLLAFVWLNLRYNQAEARYLFAAWPALAIGLSRPASHSTALWFLVSAYLLPYALMWLPLSG